MPTSSEGSIGGTVAKSKRMEAIRITLSDDVANKYDVYYRTHIQEFGWTGWSKNGGTSGSTGYGYRMEAIQVVLVDKNESAPGSLDKAYYYPTIRYNTHIQDIGNTVSVFDGLISGTTENLNVWRKFI